MRFFVFFMMGLLLTSCSKEEDTTGAALAFQYKFDTSQERLNNIGQVAIMPAGHAAQNPDFKGLSVHYIELAPNMNTFLGNGEIVYKGPETSKGGEDGVDFDKAIVSDGQTPFYSINIKDMAPGTYEWVRVSVTYQSYDVLFNLRGLPVLGDLMQQKANIASFVGFNTYIGDVKVGEEILSVNDDKKQGFWAFGTQFTAPYDTYNRVSSGQAPAGATTVVNPLFNTSPVPAGSCVVTGQLREPLVITGNETVDKKIKLSFSVNNSFEWIDSTPNGQLDFFVDDPSKSEKIVDMGLRGLKAWVE